MTQDHDQQDRRDTDLAAHLEQKRAEVPPVVYLPTTGVGGAGAAEVEMRRTNDGRTALLAYTALDRLFDSCGRYQPWALMPTDRLGDIGQDQPFDVIYLDMQLPQELRREEPEGGVVDG